MNALFLSTLRKQLKGCIALSFLLISISGTHWIGFAHGISHSGIQHQKIELSCIDQAPTLEHDSVGCHLYDALTLAGFTPSAAPPFAVQKPVTTLKHLTSDFLVAGIQLGLYQSRAPPAFIL